jgi:Na+/proline symporter
MYWAQVVIGFWSLPATEHLSGLIALVVLVFGSVGMIATPGGIGAYPILLATILELYGISKADGNAFGWVSWSAQTFMVIVLGILSLIILPIYNSKPHGAQTAMDPE